ncbi:MAG: hypothetical protein ABL877_01840 [Thiobacillus sp.]
MKLLDLSPEEHAFFTGDRAAGRRQTDWGDAVGQRLAALLGARLQRAVSFTTLHAEPAAEPKSMTPQWQIDSLLTTCWITRRLGGQGASGQALFVPRVLSALLDQALAETWLDALSAAPLDILLVWQLRIDGREARLGVQLPAQSSDFVQWVEEVVRRG